MHEPGRRAGAGHFTVASYNVHRCIGTDGVRDPERIAVVITELESDVVALQEVEGGTCPTGGLAHLAMLARDTGFVAVPGTTLFDARGEYGNALLTRHPVRSITQVDLSVPSREPRGAVVVELETADGTIRVAGTHLGLRSGERRGQVERLLAALPRADGQPLVLLGDFNEWLPGSNVLRRLRTRFGGGPPIRTFPSWRPLLALDRIFAEPAASLDEVRIHRSRLARIASDHLPVRARIRVPS